MGLLEWFILAAIGAVIFLDAWPIGQTMLSRPIVTGPLAGLALGAPGEGAFWGAVFEAVYLGVLPVGAARYPDAGLAALVGTAVAVAVEGTEAAGYLVAVAIAAGELGERATRIQRRWNGRVAARVRRRVSEGDLRAPGRAIAGAVARGALIGASISILAVAIALVGVDLVEGTVWSGPVSREGLRMAALAAVAVSGGRLFLERRRGKLAWAGGLAGVAGLAWWAGGLPPP
ncbi:MAG: PTS sugar transporter subunit IIC [Gemmatimonadota bacterium]